MTQLVYVANDTVRLSVETGHLRLQKPAQRLAPTVPLDEIEQLILAGGCQLDARSLRKLCATGIPVLLLDSRHPTNSTFCFSDRGGNLHRRWQQHQWLTDDARQTRYMQALIGQKIRGQRHLLQQAMHDRPELRHPLFQSSQQLTSRLITLRTQGDADSLRGLEGAASASFFNGYHLLFAPSLGFSKRNRRPPTDPVNASLSLGYTLLLSECLKLLLAQGLDPWLGGLHRPAYNRPSLACDLQELGRIEVEHWVWQLFRTQMLTAQHFQDSDGGGRLDIKGAALDFQSWAHYREPLLQKLRCALRRYMALATPAASAPQFGVEGI